MKLLSRIQLLLTATFAVLFLFSWNQRNNLDRQEHADELLHDAQMIHALLSSTQEVYHRQLTESGLPINDQTIDLMPSHNLAEIASKYRLLSERDVYFNNVSDRPQNPNNLADAIKQSAIDYFRSHKDNKYHITTSTDKNSINYTHYNTPIWMQDSCLGCHGSRDQAPEAIRTRFDDGYDYKVGDLRGILSIRIPMSIFESRAQTRHLHLMLEYIAGLLVILLIIILVHYFWIGRPIHLLHQRMNQWRHGEMLMTPLTSGVVEFDDLDATLSELSEQLITSRKKAEEAQHNSQTLIENARDALIGIDESDHIQLFNHAAETLFGYQKAEVIGTPLSELIPHELRESHQLGCQHFVETGEGPLLAMDVVEVEVLTKSGILIPVELSLSQMGHCAEIMILGAMRDISQRKKIEQELHQVYQRSEEAQQLAHMGHWEWDIKSDLLSCSDEIYRIFGLLPQEFEATYQTFLKVVHPDDRSRVDHAVNEAIQSGHYEITHRIVPHHNNQERIVRAQAVIERDHHNRASKMLGTVLDVTELEQAKNELNQQKNQLSLLLESTGEGIYGVDNTGYCTFCNSAAVKMFGYETSDQLVGLHIHELTHYAHADGSSYPVSECSIYQSFVTNTTTHREDEWFWRADGSGFAVEVDAQPIIQDGETIGAVCVFSDITERLEREATNRKLASAVEHTTASITITNIDGNIEYANPHLLKTTGYQAYELIGENPRIFASGQTPPETYKELWATLTAGKEWRGNFYNRTKGGADFIEEAWIAPIMNRHGTITHYVAVKEDISERRQWEERIQHHAYHDSLTALPNRLLFMEHLNHVLTLAKREESCVALLYIDLDGFKPVNDTHGHDMGDMLLRQVAARIGAILRESDLAARLGGDEFAIILPNVQHHEAAAEVGEKIRNEICRSFDLGKIVVNISASIGIALYPEMANDIDSLIKAADQSMYLVKQGGRNGVALSPLPSNAVT